MGEGEEWESGDECEPVYADYYGIEDYFFYAWVWSEMVYDHDIYCHDCTVVDDQGQAIFEVGDNGFHAGASSAMDPFRLTRA